MSNAGMKLTYPLVFGTKISTKSVFGNAVLDENFCFFFFFLFEPIGICFDSNLPKFGVHRFVMRKQDTEALSVLSDSLGTGWHTDAQIFG